MLDVIPGTYYIHALLHVFSNSLHPSLLSASLSISVEKHRPTHAHAASDPAGEPDPADEPEVVSGTADALGAQSSQKWRSVAPN